MSMPTAAITLDFMQVRISFIRAILSKVAFFSTLEAFSWRTCRIHSCSREESQKARPRVAGERTAEYLRQNTRGLISKMANALESYVNRILFGHLLLSFYGYQYLKLFIEAISNHAFPIKKIIIGVALFNQENICIQPREVWNTRHKFVSTHSHPLSLFFVNHGFPQNYGFPKIMGFKSVWHIFYYY